MRDFDWTGKASGSAQVHSGSLQILEFNGVRENPNTSSTLPLQEASYTSTISSQAFWKALTPCGPSAAALVYGKLQHCDERNIFIPCFARWPGPRMLIGCIVVDKLRQCGSMHETGSQAGTILISLHEVNDPMGPRTVRSLHKLRLTSFGDGWLVVTMLASRLIALT